MLNSTYAKSQFKYEIYLCESSTPYDVKGCLTTASTNRKFKWQLRNVHEMTLTIPEKFEDGTDNSLFDSVEKTNVIKVEKWIGDEITEIFMYHIAEITIASDVHQYKDIKAYSLEERWNNFHLREFNHDTQLYTGAAWNSATPADSGIMDYILGLLKNTWTVGYISSGLLNSTRVFDISSAKLLDVVRIIESNYNCIFIFDTYRHSIDIVEYGDVLYVGGLNTNTGLILDHKNYVDQYKSQMDIDEIVTRLYVYGSGDTNISSVNVTGELYVDDFSFFMNTRYMTQGLIDALTTLTALRESKYTEYTSLLAQLLGKQLELDVLNYELFVLNEELIILEDAQDVAIKDGDLASTPYSTWQTLIVAKKAEITTKEGEITTKNAEIVVVNASLSALYTSVSYETNLTAAQQIELLNFIKEDEATFVTDDPVTLIKLGWDYLEIKAKTSYNIGVNVTDILSSKADSFMWNKIRLGHKVNLLIPYTTDGSGGTQADYPYDPDPTPSTPSTPEEPVTSAGYIYGGYAGGASRLRITDEYVPNAWTNKTDMPLPNREQLAASTIGSSGYAYGGKDGGSVLQDCDEYTPDSWANKTDLPTPVRYTFAASTIGSSGYVYGGYSGSATLQDCDEYTPDTWANKADMPTPARYSFTASTIGSSGYVYGGYGTSRLQDCDEYTPDSWANKTSMPAPARFYLASSTIGSSSYVYGGLDSTALQDCDEYTPDTWTSKTDMPTPARRSLAASTIGSSGYVYGGYTTFADTDEYTPDTWVNKTDMLSGRSDMGATSI